MISAPILGPYSLTILENLISLVLHTFIYLESFLTNTTSDWLNRKKCYIQIYKSCRKRQRTLLRMVGEYGPCSISSTYPKIRSIILSSYNMMT